jgi:phosphatidylinositol 4-kinase
VQVVRHTGSDELLLMVRMMQGSMQLPSQFSSHPAAAGTFFTLLFLGLKLCDCLLQTGHRTGTFGANLLCDRIYRYLQWFNPVAVWQEGIGVLVNIILRTIY